MMKRYTDPWQPPFPSSTGPPGPPVGPIKFTEVFAERIGLAWSPPTDDGGSKITNYVVEKREESRKSWVHVSNEPKDCAYVVTRLTENHEYEFRVMAQNKFGVGPPLASEPEKARNLFSEFTLIINIHISNISSSHLLINLILKLVLLVKGDCL